MAVVSIPPLRLYVAVLDPFAAKRIESAVVIVPPFWLNTAAPFKPMRGMTVVLVKLITAFPLTLTVETPPVPLTDSPTVNAPASV